MPVPQYFIESAFVRMWNVLGQNYLSILSTMLEQLVTLEKRSTFNQSRIHEIDKEIIDIGKQSMILHRLHGSGHMDTVYFYEQSLTSNQYVNSLRNERRRLMDDNSDTSIRATQDIIDVIATGPDSINTFKDKLFDGIVEKVIIKGRNELDFQLYNGLKIAEHM